MNRENLIGFVAAGITKAFSKAAVSGAPQTPVTTAINIKANYDAKYGAPTAAKPKVFIFLSYTSHIFSK